MTDPKSRADARLEAALQDADQQDPRPYFRDALRRLKHHNADGFQAALHHFEEELVPAVAGEADPLLAWWAYGEMLASTLGSGRTMELDTTGRARPLSEVGTPTGLVLRIPDDAGAPTLVMRAPRELSSAQQGAIELLVAGRHVASAYG